jgi:AraC-like DNA-binding protein
MIRRQIVYRLLTGEQGGRLRHLPVHGDNTNRIVQAIQRLRKELDRPLSIEGLAKELGMSPSGFHHHFKAVTDMSPLQFQKQMRLQEARRLMLSENLDAGNAGYRVGYDDASYFSRDYKKHFGHSPSRDAERLRSMVAAD